jgi:hypothetical protein
MAGTEMDVVGAGSASLIADHPLGFPGTPIMLRPVHFECVDFLGADIACDQGRIVGSEAKPG